MFSHYSASKSTIIISTYDSSKHIYDALKDEMEIQPDLIIFDEAHNTTGDKSKISQSLMNLTAEKKMFMTATPLKLIFKNNKKIQSSYLDQKIFTRNNPGKSGEIFYEYTFNQGIENGIICDFEHITLENDGANNDELQKIISNLSKLQKKEKQDVYFTNIAFYLIKCIQKKNLKHTLVFLTDQNKLKIFKTILEKLTKEHNYNYDIYSIISSDKKSERNKTENKFKKSGNTKILLSVGIFNEGIDLPCIDSVMFANERSSSTTIVQNIGRCLRIFKNGYGGFETGHIEKTCAYVIIPTVLHGLNDEDDEDNEVYSSSFKQIRYIVNLLRKDTCDHFYAKNVTKKISTYKNEADNSDGSDFNDEIIDSKIEANLDIVEDKECPDTSKIENIINSYIVQSSNKNISNKTLSEFQTIIKRDNINTLQKWSRYINDNNIKQYLFLHQEFRKDWISWGHLFYDHTFTYNESKLFIKNNVNMDNIVTSSDWIKYFHITIEDELSMVNNNIFNNNLLKIPNRPKEYYKDDFIGWDDFLGIELDKNIVMTGTNPNYENNADQNLKNILNEDHKKIQKNIKWQDYDTTHDLNKTSNFINNRFNIDSHFQLQIKFKKSGKFEKSQVLFYKNECNKIIAVVDPTEKIYTYDNDCINNPVVYNAKDKSNLEYMDMISDSECIRELEILCQKIKKTINI
jgi:superfamily II DNA or RNA helicase